MFKKSSIKAKSSKITPLTEIETQIAALEAQKQLALVLAKEQQTKERAALNEKFKELPGFLGLPSIVEVRKFVNIYSKHSTCFPTSTRARLSAETRAAVKDALTAEKPLTLAEIAQQNGISAPTVFGIKKSLGLTKGRKVNA